MNISGGGISGAQSVTTTSSNVVTTGLNNNASLPFLPQMALITPTINATALPTTFGDNNSIPPSSVQPIISVITCSNNVVSNQHSNEGFLMSSGTQNNFSLAGSSAIVPVNVILTSVSESASAITANITAGGENDMVGGNMEMQPTSIIPASIIVRNRQHYQPHGNIINSLNAAAPYSVAHNPTAVTIFTDEIPKQFPFGIPPKNIVLTQVPTTNGNNLSQTLLKPPSAVTNIGGIKSQSTKKTSTGLINEPKKCTLSCTGSSIDIISAPKKHFSPVRALQSPCIENKPVLPLSEVGKDIEADSSLTSLNKVEHNMKSNTLDTDMSKGRLQTAPSAASTPKVETSTRTNSSSNLNALMPNNNVSKKTPNTLINSDGSVKVEIDLTKPVLLQAKLVEKQESLLKVPPMTKRTIEITSPRSQRSKSLSSAFKESQLNSNPILVKPKQTSLLSTQNTLSERRHSTASENKTPKQKVSPPRRKQALSSKSTFFETDYEIIDLVDYNEENIEAIAEIHQKINSEKENNILESQTDNQVKEKIQEMKVKTSNIIDKNVLNSGQHEFATDKLTETSTNKYPSLEIQHEMPPIKVEIILKEDENQINQQQAFTAEKAEITVQDSKVEDTQTSVEHTQDSLEKSLYCDEKISLSSTSSASTSSSRQSLHDDSQMPSSSIAGQNVISKLNLPSTSAAAGVALALAPTAKTNTTSAEDSLSCALKMLSNFNMLTWNQRVGSARGTYMRFQLNEFNLIEINERCLPRTRIHTAYEKPIYERESVPNLSEKNNGLLYLCRRCNCHGPALDFLAPEFCSLDCLKRESRKRRHEEYTTVTRKRKTQESNVQVNSKKSFRWSTYLPEKFNAIAAPVNLFINPFPTGPNRFQIGMKLEAIDPENCSLFCVCTIVDIQGYRLKLTFDGYEYMYDFWVNADSMDIFPPGWCTKTKRVLQPPKGKSFNEFNWLSYLTECKAITAQRALFTHLNASLGTHNPFKIGMHLEAEDLNDTGKLCVASVSDVLDNRIRVHFDGWDDCYDYWVDISSPYIHPCGWHVGRQQLIVPPEFENTTFSWTEYIKTHGSGMAATEEMFSTRDPIDFKTNMKLEVVDPRNPSLIRPATVVGRKGHRIKLHLDCWASNYCFWLEDDSADLHPIGWCEATSHDLEPPPGYKLRTSKIVCSTFGCRGIGNAKRLYLNTHTTKDCCPYAPENWRQKSEKPPRLEHDEIIRPDAILKRDNTKQNAQSLKWKQPKPPQSQLKDAEILQQIQLLDNIKTRHLIQQEKQQQKLSVPQSILRTENSSTSVQQQSLIKTELSTQALRSCQTVDSSNIEQSTSLLIPQIKIAKEFLCDYGPRLQQNYKIWQRNVAFDMQRIKRNPLLWSTRDTCAFVQCVLQNSEITERFLREDIDGNALLLLQQSDLTEILNLKLGPAVKIFSCILQLRTLAALKFNVKLGAKQISN
ncbi:uncharacterized protein LOC101462021 isoform X1 [Ceratitis capitata]|nr:uncharacterized protein LOC101462021 isoform X1 [Ceratitis capitata]XP_004519572.1 uncharacterized protein LOC101462021 isoform X1 [Ceratitis capitata]XP_012162660.1 uncharacterized protein LOC101462021 isoform X1 [Ceratitis capitata]